MSLRGAKILKAKWDKREGQESECEIWSELRLGLGKKTDGGRRSVVEGEARAGVVAERSLEMQIFGTMQVRGRDRTEDTAAAGKLNRDR